MTYGEIYQKATTIIREENIEDYRPAGDFYIDQIMKGEEVRKCTLSALENGIAKVETYSFTDGFSLIKELLCRWLR